LAAQPHVAPAGSPLQRWAVAGGVFALATVAAVVRSLIRRPSPVHAALALDERFGLKERVTTGLTLAPADAGSPAALALLEDVNGRVDKLAVPDRFPVRLPRSAWLLPLTGAALALVAIFYKPVLATPHAVADEPLAPPLAVRDEIDKKMDQLRKKADEKRPDDKDRSAELERLEADLDRVTRQPRDTKDQARDVVKELTGIEDQIKKREQELKQRADALKEQMKQAGRLSKKEKSDGPAKDLERALQQGDVQKAKEALDRLAQQLKSEEEADRIRKKLEDKGLSKEERAKAEQRLDKLKSQQMSKSDKERLGQQMKDIKDKLQRLSRNKEEKEQELRDKAEKGELDKDQLQRELDRLDRDSSQLSEKDLEKLKDMAEKLGKCEQCLKDGQDGEASQLLEEAGSEMGQLDRDGELQELAEKLKECEECKGAMCEALDGKPVPAAGRRPESKQTVTNSVDKRERAKMGKGQLSVIDTVPGQGFKGPRKPAELRDEIQQASQEAPEAIDRQRLPRSASDMARGYFEKMRGEREKKEKP
jgi:hypothetical protein